METRHRSELFASCVYTRDKNAEKWKRSFGANQDTQGRASHGPTAGADAELVGNNLQTTHTKKSGMGTAASLDRVVYL